MRQVAVVTVSPSDSVSSLRAAIHADAHRGSPAFLFSYADGVPIDRGQEDRLRVRDMAVHSPISSALDMDLPWEQATRSQETLVFVQGYAPMKEQTTSDAADGGGLLHRWENLEGGQMNREVRECTYQSSCLWKKRLVLPAGCDERLLSTFRNPSAG